MGFKIRAFCECNTGKKRKNNEDNFFFQGQFLDKDHDGTSSVLEVGSKASKRPVFAIFDGMGGEQYGEFASYCATTELFNQLEIKGKEPFSGTKKRITRIAHCLNETVFQLQEKLLTTHIGTTMVGVWFSARHAYIANLGDSRAYILRDSKLLQLSHDHVEASSARKGRKAPLTQYLGMDSNEIQIEPSLKKVGLRRGDIFLLCSDGLTDMVSEDKIQDIMIKTRNSSATVSALMQSALEYGGRDNITIIICDIT